MFWVCPQQLWECEQWFPQRPSLHSCTKQRLREFKQTGWCTDLNLKSDHSYHQNNCFSSERHDLKSSHEKLHQPPEVRSRWPLGTQWQTGFSIERAMSGSIFKIHFCSTFLYQKLLHLEVLHENCIHFAQKSSFTANRTLENWKEVWNIL